MLKATIDADILKESIDAISALVTECRLHTDEGGISARAVDTANVAMISLSLKKEAFASYAATTSELGIDIAKMKNIFGMMSKDDILTLDLPDEGHKMQISFQGYKYSITLLDANTIRKDPNPPTIELPGKVVLSGNDLNSAIKAAAVVSDKIALGIDQESGVFYMIAEGDTDHIRREFGKNEVKFTNLVDVRSLFSLDYLKDMGKVMSRSESVEVQLGNDHPVKFSFDIAGGKGHVEYLLAPRIEAD
ncbi:MAG: DNA polymerase sliding clamp [Methanoregulaceae archaeon]|nr:DNA polymerase sliding clamp [Methanoregulaceae archaeon]